MLETELGLFPCTAGALPLSYGSIKPHQLETFDCHAGALNIFEVGLISKFAVLHESD